MTEKKINFRNSTLAYTITGKGKPVVLIHGFAENGKIWSRQVEFLQDNYMLIVPDIPGSGKSPVLADEDQSIENYADCIKAIIEAENLQKVVIIGHSMGGYIALNYLEKYPEDLVSLGLFHSTAYADDQAKVETREKAIQFIMQNGAPAFLKTSIPGLFNDINKNSVEIQTLLQQGSQFSAEALTGYYKAMIHRPDRATILKQTTIPVLIIAGLHDKAVLHQHCLEQSHFAPITFFYTLKESGHMGMLEETEKSNQILAYFLHSISY